jgi:hypothetical protein
VVRRYDRRYTLILPFCKSSDATGATDDRVAQLEVGMRCKCILAWVEVAWDPGSPVGNIIGDGWCMGWEWVDVVT